jgi:hypothetical protein
MTRHEQQIMFYSISWKALRKDRCGGGVRCSRGNTRYVRLWIRHSEYGSFRIRIRDQCHGTSVWIMHRVVNSPFNIKHVERREDMGRLLAGITLCLEVMQSMLFLVSIRPH